VGVTARDPDGYCVFASDAVRAAAIQYNVSLVADIKIVDNNAPIRDIDIYTIRTSARGRL